MPEKLGNMEAKQEVVVMLNSNLMRQVDALSTNRAQAIEEALYLWCQRKTQTSPAHMPSKTYPSFQASTPQPKPAQSKKLTPVEYLKQRHDNDETGWLV